MERVIIESGTYRFVAELHTDLAPKTCDAFKKMLPLTTRFIHVRWSGEGIWIPYGDERLGLDYENHISHPVKGEMLLYPGGISEMELILSYGRCCFASQYGQLAGNHFLTIKEGLEELPAFGKKVLWDGSQEVTFRLE
jgi:hypothetical protein